METGRVINKRYLLQRLIQQGSASSVYQGVDQVLQRAVAIKVVPAEQIPVYRAAIRATAQFSHPNIIGLYDLIVEPDVLYVVQEYVEGDTFETLLQSHLTPYYVADLGMQICQALLYATTSPRKVCHGDLTPASILRDRSGQIRVNNFALSTDMYYFSNWSIVGGNNSIISDPEIPLGQMSDGRKDDDVRAVGLLMYQLLAGRSSDATVVEPPADGRLRFQRNVPAELCDVIARTAIRQHPQHITTADLLQAELKVILDQLEPPPPPVTIAPAPAYKIDEFSASSKHATSGALRDRNLSEATYNDTRARLAAMQQERDAGTTAADNISMKLAAARPAAYAAPELPARRINLPLLLLIGLVLFILFFVVGYFIAHSLLP
ncbi:protein kinase domain-containing protein [Tengunoibacter tsumagoiensis]|uniref:Protein kinase domain-containing protein n=1 Tax=Tengunoibacter tsumagoiensis TaxID=2014871 RepID=A0A401ZUZ7_9CHLR|nr:protein kinase [Tengunoibacter tsumagoiensis]GCE10721.1 hypothetical protein KTT_05800 [Tengunoibacter tsumagoiensis]